IDATCSSELWVLGSSTLRLCDTMYVAETIMITSSTSTTSTMGVTLMPTMGAARPLPLDCMVPAISRLRQARRLGPGGAVALVGLVHGVLHHLVPDLVPGRRPGLFAGARVVLEQGEELLADLGDVALDLADLLLHHVEGHHRGDGDEEPDAGGD